MQGSVMRSTDPILERAAALADHEPYDTRHRVLIEQDGVV